MNKKEYLEKLKSALEEFDTELAQEILADYEEHFHVGEKLGKSEEAVIAELGSVEELVSELRELSGVNAAEERKKAEEKEEAPKQEEKGEKQQKSYYEKNVEFNFDFDKMMEDVGKKLDQAGRAVNRAMKEAGEALDKINIDIDFGSKKRNGKSGGNTYYTWSSSDESSTTNSEETKKTESYEESAANCKRAEIFCTNSDVMIEASASDKVQIDYTNSSYKDSMLYPLYYYQKGDCLYIGIDEKKAKTGEYKSGFFHINVRNSKERMLTVKLPSTIEKVTVSLENGDIEAKDLSLRKLDSRTDNGDIEISDVNAGQILLQTDTGDISVTRVKANESTITSDTGDICVSESQVEEQTITADTGDISVQQSEAGELNAHSDCGDISLKNSKIVNCELQTDTGDIEATGSQGYAFSCQSDCGDMVITSEFENYELQLDSGDISLTTHDANISANCDCGDIAVTVLESKAKYRRRMESDCGNTSIKMQKTEEPAENAPEKTLSLYTDRGDICVTFQ